VAPVVAASNNRIEITCHLDDKITLRLSLYLVLLLVRAAYNIWVLFFAHIPFMVNHTFNATPTGMLQLYVHYSQLTSFPFLGSLCTISLAP